MAKELFVINDYNTGYPMLYYLTDNATECKNILEDIDALEDKDEWVSMFENECANKGVKVKSFNNIETYDY